MPTWNPAPENELEQKLLEVGEIALQSAAECGASSAEITIGQGQGISVTVRNGDVETIDVDPWITLAGSSPAQVLRHLAVGRVMPLSLFEQL